VLKSGPKAAVQLYQTLRGWLAGAARLNFSLVSNYAKRLSGSAQLTKSIWWLVADMIYDGLKEILQRPYMGAGFCRKPVKNSISTQRRIMQ
jgi:hypothetical protein